MTAMLMFACVHLHVNGWRHCGESAASDMWMSPEVALDFVAATESVPWLQQIFDAKSLSLPVQSWNNKTKPMQEYRSEWVNKYLSSKSGPSLPTFTKVISMPCIG